MTMKSVLAFALFSYVVGSTLARPLPPLSAPEFADTEVTACHSLDQAMPSVCGLKFDLAFDGTPSNNVEITFGRDEDGDGSLAFSESDIRVGWDCGRYFAGVGREPNYFNGSSLEGVRFLYCLNPTPLDRNLEWDMKTNLCPDPGNLGERRP